MPWTYRDAGAWGGGVGRPLTVPEGDGNTYETQTRVEALEGTIYEPNGIVDVIISGSTWSLLLTDGTTLGPFVMPTTVLRPRGNWAPGISYAGLDLVIVPGVGLYLVLQNHISAATFDPNLQIGGTDVYKIIIDTSILTSVITISSSSHTPTVLQAGAHFRCTNLSGCTVTLPNETTAAIPIRSVYQWEQAAEGQVFFIPEDGSVIMNIPPSKNPNSAEQFAIVSAIKVAANTWTLAGYLSAQEV